MHSGIIRDVGFLHESWPWCSGHKSLVSVASDGLCKVMAYLHSMNSERDRERGNFYWSLPSVSDRYEYFCIIS